MISYWSLFTVASLILLHSLSYACEGGVLEVPKLKDVGVEVDGRIQPEEYPITFSNPNKDISLSWVCDDSLIYVGLEMLNNGWIGVAFGATSIDDADVIALACHGDSVVMQEQGWTSDSLEVGWGEIDEDLIVDVAGADDDGRLRIELVYRWLRRGFEPGQSYGFLIPYNKHSKNPSDDPTGYSTGRFAICTEVRH
jgi:hypothetical protein